MNKGHLNKYEYISIISIILIIVSTMSEAIISNNQPWSIFGMIGGVLQVVGSLGFPLLLMATGCILTNNNYSIYQFYKKIIKKFILPSIVYFIICYILSNGEYKNLWFTNTIIGLLVCTPFINIFLSNISDKLLKIFVVLIIISRTIQLYLPLIGIKINIDLNIFNNWIVFYILGYAFNKISDDKFIKDIYKIGIISFILIFLLRGVNIDINLFSISPIMIFYSAAVFIKLKYLDWSIIERKTFINNILQFINKHKIGIYLLHNYIIINLLQNKWDIHANRFKVIIGSIVVMLMTLILSSTIAFLIDKFIISYIYGITKRKLLKNINRNIKEILINNKQYIIWIVLSSILTLALESISRGSLVEAASFSTTYSVRFLINYLVVLVVTSPCILFKRMYFVFTIISEILILLSISSFVVSSFRGVPLTYSDLYSIKDGIAVAGQYLNTGIIIATILVIFILVIIAFRSFRYKTYNNWKKRFISIILIFILSIAMNMTINSATKKGILIPNQWDIKLSYNDNGFLYSLYNSFTSYKRKKPQSYNKENIDKIKNDLTKNSTTSHNDKKSEDPNIIMLQIESVFDPMRIDGLKFSKDPMPNIRKAMKNNSSGKLYVPTFGGGTARSEFEVVTGMNVDYLSPGEIPHNSILKKQPVESLAYILNEKVYDKTLIHNHEGSFYDRNKVYENLGFKRYIPIEYMYNIKYVSSWASDEMILENVKKTLQTTQKRDFIFGLGVQTHGGYDHNYQNKDSKVKVSGDFSKEQLNQMQDYVDDLVMVDKVVGELIDYVQKLDEPTILAVYSDHLPNIDIVNSELSEEEKYTTEYFIYDNMGLEKNKLNLEAYQLSTEVLDKANITGGVMNQIHRTYKDNKNYQQILSLVEYDMLSGKDYIFEGTDIYKKTNLKLGLDEITISDVKIDKDKIIVKGNGFNEFSYIYIDGKRIETEHVSDKKLVGNISNKDIKEVTVHQISRYSKSIGKTKVYNINKK